MKKLPPEDFGREEPQTFYYLAVNNDVLWSIGPKDVVAFDGKTWTRID